MQDGLQTLEDGEADAETINVVFRAVHSIKGGAGAFGLDDLVSFAHAFETALDGVRSGTIAVDSDVLKLFFQGGDVLADHVRAARDDAPLAPEAFADVWRRSGRSPARATTPRKRTTSPTSSR